MSGDSEPWLDQKDAAIKLLCCHVIRQKLIPGAVSTIDWHEVLQGWCSICQECELSSTSRKLLALVALLVRAEQCKDGCPQISLLEEIVQTLSTLQSFSEQSKSMLKSADDLLLEAKRQQLGSDLLPLLNKPTQSHPNVSLQLFCSKIEDFVKHEVSLEYQKCTARSAESCSAEEKSDEKGKQRSDSITGQQANTEEIVDWSSDESSFVCTPPSRMPRRLPPLDLRNRHALLPIRNKTDTNHVSKGVPWGEEELELLMEGVERYGVGNWKMIQEKQGLKRSNINIKDKWRNLTTRKHKH